MDKEKAERIIKIVNWVRYIILAVFLTFVFVALSKAQTTHDFGVWYSAGKEKKINLVLVFVDDTFVLAHIGHGGHLFSRLTVASPSFFREIRRVSHCDITTTG